MTRHDGGTISRKIVTAMKNHRCAKCGQYIRTGEKYLRLYGSSGNGETPYAVKECAKCRKYFFGETIE